jgi:hypothetical protein
LTVAEDRTPFGRVNLLTRPASSYSVSVRSPAGSTDLSGRVTTRGRSIASYVVVVTAPVSGSPVVGPKCGSMVRTALSLGS